MREDDAMGVAAVIRCGGSMSLKDEGEVGDFMPGPTGGVGEVGKSRIGSLSVSTSEDRRSQND